MAAELALVSFATKSSKMRLSQLEVFPELLEIPRRTGRHQQLFNGQEEEAWFMSSEKITDCENVSAQRRTVSR
jgi:hypothetical protein